MGGKNSGKRGRPKAGNYVQNKLECLRLRRNFVHPEKIAEQLGISRPTVYRMLREANDEINKESLETAADLRAIAAASLEQMAERAQEEGNDDRLLKINESFRKLFGLDAPTKIAAQVEQSSIEIKIDLGSLTIGQLREMRAMTPEQRREYFKLMPGAPQSTNKNIEAAVIETNEGENNE